ncbi:MAG: hypothetical protein AAB262_14265 [Elusimicrobiota bacterium]
MKNNIVAVLIIVAICAPSARAFDVPPQKSFESSAGAILEEARSSSQKLRENSHQMSGVKIGAHAEGQVLLSELKPGTEVTLSQALSEQITRDKLSFFSMTTYINGIKVDIENLRGAVAASVIPGPGLWAGVNTVPGAARGECAVAPRENVLSIVAVRLSETNGKGASLVLDFGGQACIDSISLWIIQGASRAPDLRGVTVKDLEETFGVDARGGPRLKVGRTHAPETERASQR